MIESIQIGNFKCIKESSLIETRPVTSVLVPNSSGKSGILEPLLLMKQTAVKGNLPQISPSHPAVGVERFSLATWE
ncbi:MAG: hypothetical protein KAW83_04900 [Dehalococcoidia bacterium]|nr:hypothetical protein [Dehalococcoidia bacterium]